MKKLSLTECRERYRLKQMWNKVNSAVDKCTCGQKEKIERAVNRLEIKVLYERRKDD